MELNFQTHSEQFSEAPPVVIIPGLFGATINWRSFARALSTCCPVFVIDQRNHGESPHSESHTYVDMVNDLLEFADRHDFERIIPCGHSMGGKTAMVFSLLYPERVDSLAVLDIAPVTYSHSHAPFLEALMAVDLSLLNSRSEADRALRDAIPDTSTRLFLLQSLIGSSGSYRWRLNLPALHAYMPEITGFPDALLSGLSSDVDTIFITGAESDYVSDKSHSTILDRFPSAKFVDIPGAGHWLHVEQPLLVRDALTEFIKNDKYK